MIGVLELTAIGLVLALVIARGLDTSADDAAMEEYRRAGFFDEEDEEAVDTADDDWDIYTDPRSGQRRARKDRTPRRH